MFNRRRLRKVPAGGHKSPLQLLIDQVEIRVTGVGMLREPSEPWIAAADLYLKLQSLCRPLGPGEIPEAVVTERLTARGFHCHWEAGELVVELPGWTAPPPKVVPIQPSLFGESSVGHTEDMGLKKSYI